MLLIPCGTLKWPKVRIAELAPSVVLFAPNMAIIAKHIIVHGRVQGVGFRFFTQRAGLRLGLAGNVRNCHDSTVEILVQGEAVRVEVFIKELEKGPRVARVERLEIQDVDPRGACQTFLIEGC